MARTGGRMLVALVASWTLSAGLGLAQGHGHGIFGGGAPHAPGFKRVDWDHDWDRAGDRDRDWKRDHDRDRDRDEHHARHQRSHHAERQDDNDRDDRSARPPGWRHGRKTGWGGCDAPPGLAKKEGCHDRESVERQRVATGTWPTTVTVRRTTAASTGKSATRKGTVVKNTAVKKATVRNATPTVASAPKATKVGPWVQVNSPRATREVQRK